MVLRMLGQMAAVAMIAVALSGCSVWENTMSGLGLYGSQAAVAAPARPAAMPAVAQAASRSNDWCRQVAAQHREDAARNGFDAATQKRRYAASYRQCLFMTGSGAQP